MCTQKQKTNSTPVESTGIQREKCSYCGHVKPSSGPLSDCATCYSTLGELQAEEVLLAPTVSEMTMTTESTTSFVDANAGSAVGVSASPLDYELADAQTSADLATFLARPVRVYSGLWSPSDPVGFLAPNLPVWGNFLNSPAIKNKVANYAFLRGNLKLKIVTNASPFLYGSVRAVYRPLHTFKGLTVSSSFPSALVPYSQMPGVWITPAHSEGAEFTCPFIWHKSFVRTYSLNEVNALGVLDLIVYNTLASANGATSSVSVQIFAWMDDVVLAGPTVGAILQSDEYGVGVVSAPASALAAAARKLGDVPVIGKFAKATEIGASALSNVAKLFGFTNVPVITDVKPVRNVPFPSLSSAEIGYTHDKLALDAKNELSIDPAIAGLGAEDELAIAHFVARESFLVGTQWPSSAPPDTPLFTSVVLPQLTYATGNAIDFTPAALVANLFKNWRGDLIFRFRFIATPFHKGRVRISYDPQAAGVQTTGDTGPFVMNKIVDLGAETDVEFRIPYQQALPWCYTLAGNQETTWTTSTTPSLGFNETFHNGVISLKVLTALTGPTTTASVGVQVFVRGAENLEFSNPSTASSDLTPYAIQSDEYSVTGAPMKDTMGYSSETSTHRALVNFGESVQSLRTLMRRHNRLDAVYIPAGTANASGVFQIQQTRFPLYYGFDPAGWQVAKGVNVPASNFPFNFASVTPWHLISNCFLAQRGSMNWVFNTSKGTTPFVTRVSRDNTLFGTYSAGYLVSAAGTDNKTEYGWWVNSTSTTAGASLNHTITTAGHAVVSPSYTPFKFQTTSPESTTNPAGPTSPAFDGSAYDNLVFEIPFENTYQTLVGAMVERYFGIGADYTLHFFMNCPTLNYLVASSVVPT